MATIKGLDARDRPPERVRDAFKKYLHIKAPDIELDTDIIDLEKLDADCLPAAFELTGFLDSKSLRLAFDEFMGNVGPSTNPEVNHGGGLIEDVPVLTHKKVSGLRLVPCLFPPTVQDKLLTLMLHRDLSNPGNQTNLHLNYDIKYADQLNAGNKANGASFFEADPAHAILPKDPHVHKPITIQGMLDKHLRWITLGGKPPADISRLLRAVFPEARAQSTTVNIFSANDTLNLRRDVKDCDIGLVSASMGCDALLVVAHDDDEGCEVIRLRSGDAVYLSGQSRFAWQGIPKIIPDSCPAWLSEWPGSKYPYWQGWMGRKRVDLILR